MSRAPDGDCECCCCCRKCCPEIDRAEEAVREREAEEWRLSDRIGPARSWMEQAERDFAIVAERVGVFAAPLGQDAR